MTALAARQLPAWPVEVPGVAAVEAVAGTPARRL
jgi:hypothetical protein